MTTESKAVEKFNAVLKVALTQTTKKTDVVLEFSSRMKKCAGKCTVIKLKDEHKCKIVLNRNILNAFPEHTINETIPHEIAHYVQFLKTGYMSHDYAWSLIAKTLGCSGNRFHQLDLVSAGLVKEPKKCSCKKCGAVHNVSAIVHKRLKAGKPYICKTCNGTIIPL